MPGFSNPAALCNGHASEAQRNLEITIIIIITRHDFLALLLKMENAKHWQDRNLEISIAPILPSRSNHRKHRRYVKTISTGK